MNNRYIEWLLAMRSEVFHLYMVVDYLRKVKLIEKLMVRLYISLL